MKIKVSIIANVLNGKSCSFEVGIYHGYFIIGVISISESPPANRKKRPTTNPTKDPYVFVPLKYTTHFNCGNNMTYTKSEHKNQNSYIDPIVNAIIDARAPTPNMAIRISHVNSPSEA
jgi:hypothetical protein